MAEAVKRESKEDQPANTGQNTSHYKKGLRGKKGLGALKERLSEKRLKQHRQWMRVMMDGQATPDNRYKKQHC